MGLLDVFKKREEKITLKTCTAGKVIALADVGDEVFSSGMLGKGVGIIPSGNIVCAPVDGVISAVMKDSKHAVGITADNGVEILIHVGIDTVKLDGKGFELFIEENQKVKCGQKLIQFDSGLISQNGLQNTVMMLIANTDAFADIACYDSIEGTVNETVVIELRR